MQDIKTSLTWRDHVLNAACQAIRKAPAGRRTMLNASCRMLGTPRRFAVRTEGAWFVVDRGDVDQSMRIAVDQTHEAVAATIFASRIEAGSSVMDVGANKGFFSLLAMAKAGPTGQVHAYEPDAQNLADLESDKALNGWQNFYAHQLALSSSIGTACFQLSNWKDSSTWGKLVDDGVESPNVITVKTSTVDDEMDRLNIPFLHAMKMDIEGGETKAVVGMEKSLAARRIGVVVLELHVRRLGGEAAAGVVERFLAAGYRGVYFVVDRKLNRRTRALLRSADLMSTAIPIQEYDFQLPPPAAETSCQVLFEKP